MKVLILLIVIVLAEVHSQFNAAGQKQILDVHNNLRSKIAKGTYVAKKTKKSSGTNILKMKWDSALAARAQKYVNTCPFCGSKSMDVGENFYKVVRNINETKGDLNKFGAEAAKNWESQFQIHGWTSNLLDSNMFHKGNINYAIQMAWARTGLVGCGVKRCIVGSMNRVVVVCNYKEIMYLNAHVYDSGPTCSKCPKGTKCEKATGLCV